MRNFLVLAFAGVVAGCGGGAEITVQGKILDVSGQLYQTKPTGYFCNGLFAGQILVALGDYSPFCPLDAKPGDQPRDPTIGHYELDLVMSTGGMPNFRLVPFTINPGTDCATGGGPAIATFLHFPPNPTGMSPEQPDTTVVAKGGTIKVTQFDTTNTTPIKGTFDLDFGDPNHVTGSFGANNCNM